MAHYDLVVIGAGVTGLGAARAGTRAGGSTRSVALVDGERPGGDCTHYGCVPSKALLEVARRAHAAQDGGRYGVHASVRVDYAAVADHVHATIAEVERDESPRLLARQGIDYVGSFARFTGPRAMRTEDGREVTGDRFVVASGGSAAVPPVPGLAGLPYLTNKTVFSLRELPGHLLVLGGGPIGCELAQAFRRLGAAVTIVEAGPRLLAKDEPEASAVLTRVLTREGVAVSTSASVVRAEAAGGGVRLHLADGSSVEGTHLLLAAGRRPETGSLDLALAGVDVDPRTGRVAVDATLRTSAPHVWAAGDCASPYQFTHTGDEQGRLAAANAFARRPRRFPARVVPWTTFTDPEVGRVGLSEAQAYAAYGERAVVAFVPMSATDRARCAGETDGFVKLVAAPRVRPVRSRYLLEVVGMTAVAPVGGELVAEAALAMRTRMLAARLAQTVHSYPTWSLATRMAAAQLFGGSHAGRGARPARPDRG